MTGHKCTVSKAGEVWHVKCRDCNSTMKYYFPYHYVFPFWRLAIAAALTHSEYTQRERNE